MTSVSNCGTTTLGLYDTQSQLNQKADITYVDNKVDPLIGGHKGFATLSQAQADQSGLAANTVVEVLSDTTEVNNGYYLWNGTTLTKTTFSPLLQANNYTDNKVATAKAEAIATAASDATTKANNAVTTANNYTDSVFADVPATLEPYITQAEAAATSANIAGKVYATAAEGVDPITGVPNGQYFNVRSSSNDNYIDEYSNNSGVAQPTGKSYPSSSFVNSVAEFTALPFKIGSSYGVNQRVRLTNGDIVKSTVTNNTTNPNVDMTGWVKTNDASQIIDASGNSQQYLNNIYSNQVLTSEMFPRLPDETDDTPRLQRAFDESFTKQQELKLVGNFTASDILYARHDFDGRSSIITFPKDFNKTALVFAAEKSETTSTRNYNKNVFFPLVETTKTSGNNDWSSNPNSCGIKVVNLMQSNLSFIGTNSFRYGVIFTANGTDANYNTYNLGAHTFSEKPILVIADGTTSKASNNQNTFSGGRMAVSLAAARVTGISLMEFVVKGATSSSINNNVLTNPSVEGSSDEYAILFKNESLDVNNVISNNTIISPRLETAGVAGKKIGFIGERTRRNLIIGGYNVFSSFIYESNNANSNSYLNTEGQLLLSGSSADQPQLCLRNQSGVSAPTFGIFTTAITDYSNVLKANLYATSQYLYAGNYVEGTTTHKRFRLDLGNGQLSWGSGTTDFDMSLSRLSNQGLKTDRKLLATQGLGVGNSITATTIPTSGLVKKIQVFDENGLSLGYIPVYSSIT